MDIENTLKQMTTEEKAALVSGTDFLYTNPIPRLGIPGLSVSDGPHGLRKASGENTKGLSDSKPATAFPTAVTTASSWNPDNTYKMGQAIGEECRYYGVHTLLGPAVNLKRNPLCGRSFEYFSEDPLLAGAMGAAEVQGVQSKGVGVAVKHFAMNNSENYRSMGNSVASEKAIRKLYLKPFEYIVKHAKPATLMCAYNQINGVYCSENKWLLTDVLRNEWGFDGVVMTDWGAMHDRVASLKAGLDLEMPGDSTICRRWILDGIADGSLPMEKLDDACRNILKWVDKYVIPADPNESDWDSHHALAAEIAADSAVLMKNEGALPLKENEKLHVEGPFFSHMRYQGAGSSMVKPTKVTGPKDAFDALGVKYDYSIEECDTILAFVGLTDDYESEGFDRSSMKMPDDHLELIDRLCKTGKPVVVVLFGGSVMELPFADNVNAILNMSLPGQNGGTACADLLFGRKNPCGKLSETWPLKYEDVPGYDTYGKNINEIYYEGCEMGYRYYNAHNIPVRYPFGYGLSYTSFTHTDWERRGDTYSQTITNTGDCFGGEVAQLYIDGELKGFKKVYLAPGESVNVEITPEPEDEIEYSDEIIVPQEPPRFPVTMESRFTDFNQTFIGRRILKKILSRVNKQEKYAKTLPDGVEKDNILKGALSMRSFLLNNSPRCMSMTSANGLPYNKAQGLVELTNRRIFKGLKYMSSTIKVPKLPKEEEK